MDQPPVPWTPVQVSGAIEVSVWGRSYVFTRGPLPAEMNSAGSNLLNAPVRLALDDGRPDRQPSGKAAIEWQRPTLTKHEPTEAVLTSRGESPGIRWKAETSVTYDGLVWITLEAAEAKALAAINRLSLVIPMKASEAQLYSHHLCINRKMTANWRYYFYNAPENLWHAGRTPEEGWSGEFTSQLWLGSYHRGLALYAETPEKWAIGDNSKVMFISPSEGGRVTMRADFAQKPHKPGDGWQLDFGLMATPVRPPETRPEAFRTRHTGGYDPVAGFDSAARRPAGSKRAPGDIRKPLIDQYKRDGVGVVLLWNKWGDLLGFPLITDPRYAAYTKAVVDYAHGGGMKVVPYLSSLGMFVSTHPEFEKLKDKFIVDTDYWKDPFSKERESRIYRVVPTKEWTDWYVAQLRTLAKEYRIDGVYLDTIHKADIPMQKRRVFYSLRDWRYFYEQVYRVFHGDVVENGYIYMHDSDPNIFILNAFGDLRLTGEMQYYAAAQHVEVRSRLPHLKDRMPLDRYFVWSSGFPLGGVAAKWCWKPPTQQTSVGAAVIRQKFLRPEILSDAEMIGLGGLFDMHISMSPTHRDNKLPVEKTVAIWKLEDDIKRQSPRWFGYWDADRHVRLTPGQDVAAAGFVVHGERCLLHVANLLAEKRVVSVEFLSATGMANRPLELAGQVAAEGCSVAAEKGGVQVSLAPNSFVRFMVRVGDY